MTISSFTFSYYSTCNNYLNSFFVNNRPFMRCIDILKNRPLIGLSIYIANLVHRLSITKPLYQSAIYLDVYDKVKCASVQMASTTVALIMQLCSLRGVSGLPNNFPIQQQPGFLNKIIKIAFQKQPIFLLNGKVIWQASDSSKS